MRRLLVFLLFIGLAGFAELGFQSALGQEQSEDVRGAFLTSRPKTTEKPAAGRTAKAVRRRPNATVTKPAGSADTPANTQTGRPTEPTTAGVTPAKTASPKIREQKIGIGLTLFLRDANGLSVRVNPSREFRRGDRVRLLLETNAEGYLYVFNTTDGGPPLMIYPDPDLDEAGNYIQAHVPVEVPSSVAAEERLRWFRFDEQPGTERLYFVFTREPLSGIPLEDDLISYCREKNSNCPMHPTADLWAQIQKDLAPVQNDKSEAFGAAQTASEVRATTRGIGLSKEDPEPSLVMMTASSKTSTLVTTLDLIHK